VLRLHIRTRLPHCFYDLIEAHSVITIHGNAASDKTVFDLVAEPPGSNHWTSRVGARRANPDLVKIEGTDQKRNSKRRLVHGKG
jgi:hypothetical protein